MSLRGTTGFLVVLIIVMVGEALYIVNQQGQIDTLNFRISTLQYQNSVLSSRCTALESNLSEVLGELENEIDEIQIEYDKLKNESNSLQYEYYRLEYNFQSLQESHAELQSEFMDYTAQFKRLKENVNSRLGLDGNLSRFVTPGDSQIIEKMLEITGGHEDPDSFDELWEDYKALYDWMTAGITCGADSPYPYLYSDPSYPVKWLKHSIRFPKETLSDRTGDCEDQAILLLSMMTAHNDRFAKWCISLNWEGGGHIAVAFPVTDGKLAILDPAGGYLSGMELGFSSEPVEEAIESWMSRWSNRDLYINSVFNDKFYQEFESTNEFLKWFDSKFGQ